MAEGLSSLVCAFRVPCGLNALTASYTSCLTIFKTKTGALLKLGLKLEKCGEKYNQVKHNNFSSQAVAFFNKSETFISILKLRINPVFSLFTALNPNQFFQTCSLVKLRVKC